LEWLCYGLTIVLYCIVLYCIVSIHLYSTSYSAHQSESLPLRETQREEESSILDLVLTKFGFYIVTSPSPLLLLLLLFLTVLMNTVHLITTGHKAHFRDKINEPTRDIISTSRSDIFPCCIDLHLISLCV